jgi:hypothetical protein
MQHVRKTGLADAEGERLRFQLGPVELSLSVTIGQEAAPGAKVRFWVIEAGADAKLSREAVQVIKLVLTPIDTHAPVAPGGEAVPPLITGQHQGLKAVAAVSWGFGAVLGMR